MIGPRTRENCGFHRRERGLGDRITATVLEEEQR